MTKLYFHQNSHAQVNKTVGIIADCVLWLKYSKTCVKQQLSKRPQIGFQGQLSLDAGQKYCRMLQGEHSAILLTFIKLPFVIKIFVLSIFESPFYTGFTVQGMCGKLFMRFCGLLIVSKSIFWKNSFRVSNSFGSRSGQTL